MAHLWIPDNKGDWSVLLLDQNYYLLSADATCPARLLPAPHAREDDILLGRYKKNGSGESWVVKCSRRARVTVNSRPIYMGVKVLSDRDEILLGDALRIFFSTERQARVEPFPGAAEPVFCPRCKREILKGALAVRCPGCDSWSHQTDEFKCWTYTPTCPVCDYPSALDAGFRWTPEEL
jgi:hypothetical protein